MKQCVKKYEDISIEKDIIDGGYPEISKIDSAKGKYLWFSSYIRTYIESDAKELANIRNMDKFITMYKLCMFRSGSIFNKNDIQTQEAISCAYCHSIKDIESHAKSNNNISSSKEKVFYSANEKNKDQNNKEFKNEISLFGMMKEKAGSPFHKIDYSNDNFYTGSVCMGCHSHAQNENGFDLCRVEEKGAKDEKTNCISCHMPKISGSATSIKITKEVNPKFFIFENVRAFLNTTCTDIDGEEKRLVAFSVPYRLQVVSVTLFFVEQGFGCHFDISLFYFLVRSKVEFIDLCITC